MRLRLKFKRRRTGRFRRTRRFRRFSRRFRRSSRKLRTSRLRIKRPIITDRVFVKLRYQDWISYADPASAYGWYQFRGNSAYDPDYSSSGHQPTGFAQWKLFFSKYRVLASKIKVQLQWQGVAPGKLLIFPDTTTTISGDETTWNYDDNPLVKSVRMMPGTFTSADAVPQTIRGLGKTSQYTLKHYMTTKKIFGSLPANDDRFYASVVADPSYVWFWNVGTLNLGAATAANYKLFDLTYYVEFSERNVLAKS